MHPLKKAILSGDGDLACSAMKTRDPNPRELCSVLSIRNLHEGMVRRSWAPAPPRSADALELERRNGALATAFVRACELVPSMASDPQWLGVWKSSGAPQAIAIALFESADLGRECFLSLASKSERLAALLAIKAACPDVLLLPAIDPMGHACMERPMPAPNEEAPAWTRAATAKHPFSELWVECIDKAPEKTLRLVFSRCCSARRNRGVEAAMEIFKRRPEAASNTVEKNHHNLLSWSKKGSESGFLSPEGMANIEMGRAIAALGAPSCATAVECSVNLIRSAAAFAVSTSASRSNRVDEAVENLLVAARFIGGAGLPFPGWDMLGGRWKGVIAALDGDMSGSKPGRTFLSMAVLAESCSIERGLPQGLPGSDSGACPSC